MSLNRSNFIDEMTKSIPGVIPLLEEKRANWGNEPEPYDLHLSLVVEDVLCKYLKYLLNSDIDTNEIARVSKFFDQMATSNSDDIVNLVKIEVSETLQGYSIDSRKYMSKSVLEIVEKLWKYR